MNAKEVVRAAVEFRSPPRVPYYIGIDQNLAYFDHPGTAEEQARILELVGRLPQDLLHLWPDDPESWVEVEPAANGDRQFRDLWGCRWVLTHKTIRVVSHPLEDWAAMERLAVPDPMGEGRFERVRRLAEANRDKYLLGWTWFTLFERMWFLRGFDNLLVDIYTEPDRLQALLEVVFEGALETTRRWREIAVDGVHFSDDWGGQDRVLINPEDWRRIFKPYYRKLFDEVHQQGAHVWLHSCGNVLDLLDDFVDLGLDVLNPVQPRAMDIAVLARRYGGKLCFNGGLDVQGTLVCGTPKDVREEVLRTIRTLGAFGGGYVGTTSHGLMPETPVRNLIALMEALEEYTAVTPGVRP